MRPGWILSAFVVAAAMIVGCDSESGSSAGNAAGIPSDAPYITGTITALSAAGCLVEENPADEGGSAKADLTWADDCRYFRRSGASAGESDLAVGQRVSAWIEGPVAQSYPVQADASVIVIEP